LINGKQYVGSSVDLRVRFRSYLNVNYLKRHPDMLICRALLKYGYSSFSLEILEYCPASKVLQREDDFFKLFSPEYNICKKAGNSSGRKHSEKTKTILRDKASGRKCSVETRGKISAAMLGRKDSEEMLAKKSAYMMGNTNGRNQPNAQKIEVLDLEKNISTIFNSIGEAAKALNIYGARISDYFNRNQIKPYKGRYVFTRR
jgi:group I intron endonuclease